MYPPLIMQYFIISQLASTKSSSRMRFAENHLEPSPPPSPTIEATSSRRFNSTERTLKHVDHSYINSKNQDTAANGIKQMKRKKHILQNNLVNERIVYLRWRKNYAEIFFSNVSARNALSPQVRSIPQFLIFLVAETQR